MLATTSKRKDMIGKHAGIDYDANVAPLRSGDLEVDDQAMLRNIFQGKTITKTACPTQSYTKQPREGNHSQWAKSGSAGNVILVCRKDA